MIDLDSKTATITVTECLCFDNVLLPVYDEIKEEVKHEVATIKRLKDSFKGVCSLTPSEIEDFKGMKDFVDHELTLTDKNEMLQYVMDEYEKASNYYESASLFDEKMIRECVLSWIQDTFGFEANY